MLKLDACLQRQRRLLAHMEASGLALAVLGNPKTIHYFTGSLVDPNRHHAFLLDAGRHSLLVTNIEPSQCAAESVDLYTGYTLERVFGRETMHRELVEMARAFAATRPGPAAVELEFVSAGLMQAIDRQVENLTPAIDRMRRRKDPDEIECLRRVISITEAGYAAVRRALEPGMTECDAYRAVHDGMVEAAGTAVDLRGDFACGTRGIGGGGAPTLRRVLAGDLYIFDLFPSFEGYTCDLCRTFVAGTPTQLQRDAWGHVAEAHRLAQGLIRPGVPARLVYEGIRAHLERFEPARGSFTHHAGHGVGMDAWEFPWLTPGSDQVIEEGDVVACEPALYSAGMQGGIRLEHNYLVSAGGVTALDRFPLDL
jgi:Xaa-Pro aminopeptidase